MQVYSATLSTKIVANVSDIICNNWASKHILLQGGYFAKSLAATHTYLLYDPDDPMMIRNMDYFKKHENTTSDMFVNLEAYPYQVSYDLGMLLNLLLS